MAGIYLHVPFCKVKCHYCDFHFSVQLKNRSQLIDAMTKELVDRKSYLENEPVQTVYFGGGTPSLIDLSDLQKMLEVIHSMYPIQSNAEFTLECNPDDLTLEKLKAYSELGINRLSIGIQSFDNEVLQFMNRAHNSSQAIRSVKMVQDMGFENITIDLIYGIPGSSLKSWQQELITMAELKIPHLSAYCLTIEENTVFGNWQKKGKIKPFADEESLAQFQLLANFTSELGMEQYEISNFAKEGFISRHNSAYWLGEKYLGIGPSAHSYNGNERGWNIAHNSRYQMAIEKGETYYETEKLSLQDRFNDYILTRLRTKWGISLTDLEKISSDFTGEMEPILSAYIKDGDLSKKEGVYYLTPKGRFIADAISADLFAMNSSSV